MLTVKTVTVLFPDAAGGQLYGQLARGLHRTSAPTGLTTRIHSATLDETGAGSLDVWATDDVGSYPAGLVWHFWVVVAGRGRWDTLVQLLTDSPNPVALEDLPPAIPIPTTAGWISYIPLDQKGVAGGVATLDDTALVPLAQLPDLGIPGLSDGTPGSDADPGAAGGDVAASRADHQHPLSTAYATAQALADEATTRADDDATLAGSLSDHAALTTPAHGGLVASTDSRLTNARPPTAHAVTHATGNTDPLTPGAIGAAPTVHTHALRAATDYNDSIAPAVGQAPIWDGAKYAPGAVATSIVPRVGWGVSIVALGDSTTEGFGGKAYCDFLELQCAGVHVLFNAGVGGNTTAQMLARLQTSVLDYAPDLCIVLAGVNDYGQGVPQATTTSNFRAIFSALLAAGILPVPCTVPSPNTGKINNWLRAYARAHRLPLVELDRAILQPDGLWLTGLTGDQTHPTALGAIAFATAIQAVLERDVLSPLGSKPLAQTNADTDNFLQNAFFRTSAGGIPTGWAELDGPRSGKTVSVIADATDTTGYRNLWQLDSLSGSGANGRYGYEVLSGVGNVGDTLEFAGHISAASIGYEWGVGISFPYAANDTRWFVGIQHDVAGQFCKRVTIPAGAAGYCQAYMYMGALGGTLILGQPALRNLTALGAV